MEINKPKVALLVMDVQGVIAGRLEETNPFFTSIAKAIKNAQEQNIPVIYVVVGFRKGNPEVSRNNKFFSFLKQGAMGLDSEEGVKLHHSLTLRPEDILITKRRISAFSGSDLEVVLRSMEINQLILTGISTSGVVLSTLREAADKDYLLTVLSDCCADIDEEVHRVLLTKVFPRQAEVMTSDEWCAKF